MHVQTMGKVLCVFLLYAAAVNGSDPAPGSFPDNIWSSLKYFATEATRIFGHLGEVFSAAVEEDCEFKCPKGATVKPNIYHEPVSNGCGVPGLQRLEKCCDNHDICYGTCQKDKEKCDRKFKECLYGLCSSIKKFVNDNSLDKGCKSVAKAFYVAVTAGGCKYYLDAQKEACICYSIYYHNHNDL